MWIKTSEGLTNLAHVKHIGLAGTGTGDVVRLYLKHDTVSTNINIECTSPGEAYQTMKRLEKMLQERDEVFDPRLAPAPAMEE